MTHSIQSSDSEADNSDTDDSMPPLVTPSPNSSETGSDSETDSSDSSDNNADDSSDNQKSDDDDENEPSNSESQHDAGSNESDSQEGQNEDPEKLAEMKAVRMQMWKTWKKDGVMLKRLMRSKKDLFHKCSRTTGE